MLSYVKFLVFVIEIWGKTELELNWLTNVKIFLQSTVWRDLDRAESLQLWEVHVPSKRVMKELFVISMQDS